MDRIIILQVSCHLTAKQARSQPQFLRGREGKGILGDKEQIGAAAYITMHIIK